MVVGESAESVGVAALINQPTWRLGAPPHEANLEDGGRYPRLELKGAQTPKGTSELHITYSPPDAEEAEAFENIVPKSIVVAPAISQLVLYRALTSSGNRSAAAWTVQARPPQDVRAAIARISVLDIAVNSSGLQ